MIAARKAMAESYWYLTVAFSFLLLAQLIILTGSVQDAFFDPGFTLLKEKVEMNHRQIQYTTHVEMLADHLVKEETLAFLEKGSVEAESVGSILERSEYLSCQDDEGNLILFNEYRLNRTLEESEDIGSYADCLMDFDSSLRSEYLSYLREHFGEELGVLETIYGNLESVEISLLDAPISGHQFRISYTSFWQNQHGSIKMNDSFLVGAEAEEYWALMEPLNESLTSLTSRIASNSSCFDTVESCVSGFLEEDLNSSNVETGYEVSARLEETIHDGDYQVFAVTVRNEDQKNLLDFRVVLENVIPLGLVDFELRQFAASEGMARLNVFPGELPEEKVNGYVVLYAYEDFFNPSYPDYDALLELLQQQIDPKDFKKVDVGYRKGEYLFSSIDSDVQMNFLYTPSQELQELEDASGETREGFSLYLYQIYDFASGNYRRLEAGKPLHAFVFAVDEKFRYYVDTDALNTKQAVLESLYSPMPLNTDASRGVEQLSVHADKEGYEQSIFVNITEYDEEFSHYDLYVMQGREDNAVPRGCQEATFTCRYLSGAGELNAENETIILTSQDSLRQRKGIDSSTHVISLGGINNAERYEVMVVPVNAEGKGVLSSFSKELFEEEFNSLDGEEISYFISEGIERRYDPGSVEVTVEDRAPPDPMRSFSLGNLAPDPQTQRLRLDWESSDGDSVDHLLARMDVFLEDDAGNEYLEQENVEVRITKEGPVIKRSTEVGVMVQPQHSRITISELIPVDAKGNRVRASYSGPYQGPVEWTDS